ncbi:MAG: hypothetical protein ACFNW0_03925 [Fretibacterium sp.]
MDAVLQQLKTMRWMLDYMTVIFVASSEDKKVLLDELKAIRSEGGLSIRNELKDLRDEERKAISEELKSLREEERNLLRKEFSELREYRNVELLKEMRALSAENKALSEKVKGLSAENEALLGEMRNFRADLEVLRLSLERMLSVSPEPSPAPLASADVPASDDSPAPNGAADLKEALSGLPVGDRTALGLLMSMYGLIVTNQGDGQSDADSPADRAGYRADEILAHLDVLRKAASAAYDSHYAYDMGAAQHRAIARQINAAPLAFIRSRIGEYLDGRAKSKFAGISMVRIFNEWDWTVGVDVSRESEEVRAELARPRRRLQYGGTLLDGNLHPWKGGDVIYMPVNFHVQKGS